MARQTLSLRVDRLEERVTILEQLPDRIDAVKSQILQLREEMHREFSNVRDDIRSADEETRRVLGAEMRQLREDFRSVADEIMGQARTLYEDMNATLKILCEGQQPGS